MEDKKQSLPLQCVWIQPMIKGVVLLLKVKEFSTIQIDESISLMPENKNDLCTFEF